MIADELSRIAMSSTLANALSRATEHARSQGHLEVSLEHMLVALCEDPDAGLVLAASNVDVARLMSDALRYLGGLERQVLPGQRVDPVASGDLRRILDAAAAAARGGRRREINGAIVLAAIVGDGKSAAAQMLQAQGLTFEGAIRALQRGAGVPQRPYASTSTEDILASARERVQSRTIGRKPEAELPEDEEEVFEEPETAGVPDYDDVPPTEPPRAASLAPERQWEAPEIMAQPEPQAEPEESGSDSGGADQAPLTAPEIAMSPPRKQAAPTTWDEAAFPAATPTPPPLPGTEPPPSWAPPLPTASPEVLPDEPPPLPGSSRLPGLEELRRPMGVGGGESAPPAPAIGRSLRSPPASVPEPRPVGRPPAASRAEIGQLVENIPRSMRVAVPALVEVRVARGDVQALAEGLQGGGAAYKHEVTVTKAMSVRLRAPDGGFYIETASPETQWIEKTSLISSDDYASWRWHVTPREKGRRRLQLIISARTVSADGLAAETALPDQVITVRVRTNYAKTVSHLVGWSVAAVIGGLIAKFGEGALDQGLQIVAKLMKG
jgi:neural Wiskott-Aldrich syndrome protein